MENNKEKNITVLYHGDCPDGFGAAFAAWKKFGENALYIPLHHSMPVPDEVEGKDVYSLDFAYENSCLDLLLEKAKSVVLIDHHITSEPFLGKFDETSFGLDHSGAVLAWKYFHPKLPVPKLFEYIEAIDLGKFDFPDAKAIDQMLGVHNYDFIEWGKIVADFEDGDLRQRYITDGELLLRRVQLQINKLVSIAEEITFEGHRCLMVNSPLYVSYIGHALYKKLPHMGVVWSRRGDRVVVSLRSDGSIDVAEIAKKYGGGGHKAAAAFSWTEKDFLKFKQNL